MQWLICPSTTKSSLIPTPSVDQWISTCLSTTNYSILVNGEPRGFFKSSRGVRQGDPLSPMIFNLVAEILTLMVNMSQEDGLINGFQVAQQGVKVPILQYADDTIMFFDMDIAQLHVIKQIFAIFELISGLQLNLNKTEMFFSDGSPSVSFANMFGCKASILPTTYLGLPLGAPLRHSQHWNSLMNRVEKRLGVWKSKLLSKGARLILAKSTLASIPVHHLTLFVIPAKYAKKLEKLIADFIWGGSFHLIGFKHVCQPKEFGGIGLRRFKEINISLLSKWAWRYSSEETNLWRLIIRDKYGSTYSHFKTELSPPAYGVGLWKKIMQHTITFWEEVQVKIGDGRKCRLWEDCWLGDQPLCRSLPNLYSLIMVKNESVRSHWRTDAASGTCQWVIPIDRTLSDNQIAEFTTLQLGLSNIQFTEDDDSLIWKPLNTASFTCKSMLLVLQERRRSVQPVTATHLPINKVWIPYCLLRINFFVYCMFLGRTMTHQRRSRLFGANEEQCSFCGTAEETIDHLFIQCNFAISVWDHFWGYFLPEPCNMTTAKELQITRRCRHLSNFGKNF